MTRSEFIVEEVIGWAARGAEMPGKIKEWHEVLRLVRLGQAAERVPEKRETCWRCGAARDQHAPQCPPSPVEFKGAPRFIEGIAPEKLGRE